MNGDRKLSKKALRFVILYNYICFKCYNAIRHGQKLCRRLVTHMLKRLALHCCGMRKSIGLFRRDGVTINHQSTFPEEEH